MSSLYNDITKILSTATELHGNDYIVEDYEQAAQYERVRLFEARRTLESKSPNEESVARAMVQLSGTQSMTSAEKNPRGAMVSAAQMYRTDGHLRESWQAMGKLVEIAHKNFDCDLKEMLGKYNENQLELLEMTLDLPWRMTYSEPVDIEVVDYAIAGQEHVYKGVEPEDTTEDDVEADIDAQDAQDYPMESVAARLKTKRESLLTEAHSKEVAHDLSLVRFDADSADAEYIAKDVAKGIADGIMKNRYIGRNIDRESVIEMIADELERLM